MQKLLCAALLFGVLFLIGVAVFASEDVAVRHARAGGPAPAGTPVVIGEHSGRIELQFKNDGPNDVFCGYVPASLSATPGTDSGARYKSGEGVIRCVFPDQELYCMDPAGGSTVSWDEAVLRTATATATATITPTP